MASPLPEPFKLLDILGDGEILTCLAEVRGDKVLVHVLPADPAEKEKVIARINRLPRNPDFLDRLDHGGHSPLVTRHRPHFEKFEEWLERMSPEEGGGVAAPPPDQAGEATRLVLDIRAAVADQEPVTQTEGRPSRRKITKEEPVRMPDQPAAAEAGGDAEGDDGPTTLESPVGIPAAWSSADEAPTDETVAVPAEELLGPLPGGPDGPTGETPARAGEDAGEDEAVTQERPAPTLSPEPPAQQLSPPPAADSGSERRKTQLFLSSMPPGGASTPPPRGRDTSSLGSGGAGSAKQGTGQGAPREKAREGDAPRQSAPASGSAGGPSDATVAGGASGRDEKRLPDGRRVSHTRIRLPKTPWYATGAARIGFVAAAVVVAVALWLVLR